MDAATLARSQPGLTLARAEQLAAGANTAMLRGGITTVRRAAMFLAQVGHESASLQYTEEIGLGHGMIYAPYCGRTFMQLTWAYNYAAFGQWVGVANAFVNDPPALGLDRWAWLGAVWYWGTHDLNAYADRGDVLGATRVINGGYNGLAARQSRYDLCLSLGTAILPTAPPAPVKEIPMAKVIEANDQPGTFNVYLDEGSRVIRCHDQVEKDIVCARLGRSGRRDGTATLKRLNYEHDLFSRETR